MQVAIFGFCDIRNFTDITEILQEGVMSFVNTIAQIVHSEVHSHDGKANKNIGDAFLLVWKFREGFRCALLHFPGALPQKSATFSGDSVPETCPRPSATRSCSSGRSARASGAPRLFRGIRPRKWTP